MRKDTQMLQKTRWTVAAAAVAVSTLLVCAARPAHAQVRRHLTAPVTAPLPTGSGIVQPPSSPAPAPAAKPPATNNPPATLPTTNPAPTVTAPVSSPPRTNPAPAVTSPTPKPPTVQPRSLPPTLRRPSPAPAPAYQPAPQGFSAGPSLLGQNRVPLGRLVNRTPPDFNGDGVPDVRHR